MRRISLLLALLVILISGCSESKSITIAVVSPEQGEILEQVFNNQYKKNTQIEIKPILDSVEKVGEHWEELDNIIAKYINENNDVDLVFGFPPEYLAGLVETGTIQSLNGKLDKKALYNFAPAIRMPIEEAGKGEIYAVTPTFNSYVLAYNKEIFAKSKIEEPKNSMSWEDLYDLSVKLQQNSKYKGLALGVPDSDEEFYYLYQILTRPIYSIEKVNNSIQVNNEMNKKYWSLFTKIYMDNKKANLKEFLKGDVAMSVMPVASIMDKELFNQFGDNNLDIGIVQMPVFQEIDGGLAYSDSLFALSTNSKSEEAATDFLNYIQGEEFANYLMEGSLLPTYWDTGVKETLIKKYGHDFSPIYDQGGALLTKPSIEADEYLKVESAGAKFFTEYLNGKDTIDSLLTAYEEDVN
ncbi:ABC transporter substrate-binding protein [Cytobacillus oceanisediminis]|uniref:ABC transporter substrate-binding protein n=1 Tax=Cytobacillus oceanisediminis 2691 TaxID=1196031 RepID=A0A160MGC9_9BACI|nr:extracellular solute-binding protein [Cytobacillus oceanisediminis]AND42376.1 hypothetical protein A361_25560 [Cytobacillus oceanisediminis 2691]MCM3245054.1 ABC transporter substrate-binding protein [Cytobacillus oceanisediminis]MCS0827232.1 ABC transporter substrate-binding protein [Cytobacillus firmus]